MLIRNHSPGGQNRNPYNLSHHAGGSSSGSASAVAANMCAFSIGTETDGSIMFPADRCSVVGIKPTVGLTSTVGVIPESPSMDSVGPFGRSVEDATIVLDIIRETRSQGDLVPCTSWLSKKDSLKGSRFGLPWKRVWEAASKSTEYKSEYASLMELINHIEEAGAQVVKVDFPSAAQIISPSGWDWEFSEGKTGSMLSEFTVVRMEFYHSLRLYLSGLVEKMENPIYSLEDVVAYNIWHNNHEGGIPGTHPAWPTGQDSLERCVESKDWSEEKYLEALEYIRTKSREEGIDAALKLGQGDLDGLLVPLQADGGGACSVAAKAGYPIITIPVGVNDFGVPFGIGIIQSAWKDHLLIKFASAIEDLVGSRSLPKFLNFEADNYPYVGSPPDRPLSPG
jgi:amidase